MHCSALVRLVRALWVPSGQGSGDAAPAKQYDAASHGRQYVAPVAFWYEPAGHISHVPRPPVGAIVPATHAVCSIEPVGA